MHQPHFKIIEWQDSQTEAVGWIVINCLINGIAGGGVFMHSDATCEEVEDLALTMSFKNSLQDPMFGGGKAGIRFDHHDPRADGVLKRFLLDNKAIIKSIWCTGADLNTKGEIIEKIAKEDLNLPSAFISLANMLYRVKNIPSQAEHMFTRLSFPLNPYFTLGEAATGHSVAEAINFLYPGTPTVMIQGFGAVGSSLAYFLEKREMAKIVGICEKDGFIYCKDGIEILPLIQQKKIKIDSNFPLLSLLDPDMIKQYNWTPKKEDETDESFLCSFLSKQPAEVFSPCATRYSITEKVINAFSNHRNQQNEYLQRAIISGANNVFSLPTLKDSLAQHNIFTIPEWVSNCGNALLFLESLKIEKLHPEWANGILLSISKRLKHLLKDALASCQNNKELLYDECTKTAIEKIQYENAVKIKKDYEKRIAC